MAGAHGGEYKDLVVFLAAAGVVVPLLSRWKISPVLGFLAAGVLLGPDGLGRLSDVIPWLSFLTIDDADQLAQLSELGVAFLLFMIGLELSWERLKAMRRLVFGFGMMQVAVCTLVIAIGFMVLGQSLVSAAVLGMGLALSSTAVVLPVMAERGRMKGAVGRTTFAALLAQDLAVAPILITVTVLATLAQTGGDLRPEVLRPALLTLAPAAIGLALLVVAGRLLMRPLFRSVAKSRSGGGRQELFVALCLLVVVGAGVAAQAVGLSMSLGALIAGLLLAETEYRREIEVNIEPFKGLLLGVFFVGVGIGLDLEVVAADPLGVFGLAFAITAVKAALIFGLARLWGLTTRSALETALVLGPAGEFAFVILNTGMVEGIASPALTQSVLVSATISMFTVPLMAMLGQRIAGTGAGALPLADDPALDLGPGPQSEDAEVLIVGFGRVGRLVAEMLVEHGRTFIAVDTDPSTVAAGRRDGYDVSYGDAARPELLSLCGIDTIRALVVTMDAPGKVDEVVAAARALRDDIILIARARDDRHAARLYGLGVTDAVPETTEASLQLAENVLVDLGVPMGTVLASIHTRRDAFRAVFQAAVPKERRSRPTRALRARINP